MKFLKSTALTVLVILSAFNINAQTYSDQDLLIINKSKNKKISEFLNKQGFPAISNTESAGQFAEKQQLLRDKRKYGVKTNNCQSLSFHYVDVGSEFESVYISKTIALGSEDLNYTKAEYQLEWDKILKKLGNPSYIEVSKDVWPNNRVGMIDYAQYNINHNGWPVFVKFELRTSGCLIATADYAVERDVNRWIEEAKRKLAPKRSAADAL